MKNDNRGPRGENRFDGPGRRTYGQRGNAPRVGRIAEDVPRARRVTGDRDFRASGREDFMGRESGQKPRRGGDLHRGGAYRSESGPKGYRREPVQDYEAPEIPEELAAEFTDVPMDEHILAGRNPIREALKAGRPMEKLLVASGDLSGAGR